MKKNAEKIKLGWYVPADCRNKFAQWCADSGLICQDDAAGALTLWPHIPAAVREQAKLQAKGIAAIDEKFWDTFRMGVELTLRGQAVCGDSKKTKKSGRKIKLSELQKKRRMR